MFDMMLGVKREGATIPDDTGLGPTELIASRYESAAPSKFTGYYGRIPVADFITGAVLASKFNITAGTASSPISFWLKFVLDGKIMIIPQYALRSGYSFRAIYQAGLAYGTDDTGLVASGAAVNQLRTVTINGYVYKVRLMKGVVTDHVAVNANNSFSSSYPTMSASEFNRMIYSVSPALGGTWDTLSLTELGFSPSIGGFNWMVEDDTVVLGYRLVRGFNTGTRVASDISTSTDPGFGWRPVLELIGPA